MMLTAVPFDPLCSGPWERCRWFEREGGQGVGTTVRRGTQRQGLGESASAYIDRRAGRDPDAEKDKGRPPRPRSAMSQRSRPWAEGPPRNTRQVSASLPMPLPQRHCVTLRGWSQASVALRRTVNTGTGRPASAPPKRSIRVQLQLLLPARLIQH